MEEEDDDVVPMVLEALVVLVVRGVAPPKIESRDEVLVSVGSGAAAEVAAVVVVGVVGVLV